MRYFPPPGAANLAAREVVNVYYPAAGDTIDFGYCKVGSGFNQLFNLRIDAADANGSVTIQYYTRDGNTVAYFSENHSGTGDITWDSGTGAMTFGSAGYEVNVYAYGI